MVSLGRRRLVLQGKEWKERAGEELLLARQSRQKGNEGRARVCARRAAGHIAGEYLRRQGLQSAGQSAYDTLRLLEGQPGISERARQIAQHLTMRLEPDFRLPVPADLLAEVEILALELLGEPLEPA